MNSVEPSDNRNDKPKECHIRAQHKEFGNSESHPSGDEGHAIVFQPYGTYRFSNVPSLNRSISA